MRGSRDESDHRPLALVAPAAALWAAVVGLVAVGLPLLLAWIANPHDDASWATALRTCGLGWLVAHDVTVRIGGVAVSLLPVGMMLVPVALLGYAGRWAARAAGVSRPLRWAALTATAAATYAIVAGAVAVAASGPGGSVDPIRAVAAAALVAVLAFGAGAAAEGAGRVMAVRVPADVRAAVRGGLAATACLVAVAAVLAAVALGLNAETAADLTHALRAGTGGGLLLLLLGLGYAPVAVVWALSYLLGPGFALGTIGSVAPAATAVSGGLPPFPLLAAVPTHTGPWAWSLLVVPVLAGVVGGVLAVRGGGAAGPSAGRVLARALGTGATAGLIVAALAALASGSLGTGRLAVLGPSALACGAAAAGLVAFGALVGELGADLRHRAQHPAALVPVVTTRESDRAGV